MGLLQDGIWVDQWYETASTKGEFKREDSTIRNWIGSDKYNAESDRYHLYVSLACPWAHRTLIFRQLKNLQSDISLSIVSPVMLEHGWTFNEDEGSSGDALFNAQYLHQIYTRHDAKYSGRVTVPILFDKQSQTIVNNESADIIRMFNTEFNHITHNQEDFYPLDLQLTIDEINNFVYKDINNGVYQCGFATTQAAYNTAYQRLFVALDKIENLLSTTRYLTGNRITEADWRLFTTLIRFDKVYFGHFKCNRQSIENYPNLAEYVRELYQWQDISETVNFKHIQTHYYFSHLMINPTQIIPLGPNIDYSRPHSRS